MKLRPIFSLAGGLLASLAGSSAMACSGAEPYLATVCMTAATFCPRGYMEADGRVLPIAPYTAVFALIGTTYGGDGRTNFALPDLRSRVPIGAGMGPGPGLANVDQGEAGGVENVTLLQNQMPIHSHAAQLRGVSGAGTTDTPTGASPARLPRSNNYSASATDVNMAASTVSVASAGGGLPFTVRNPYLGLRYCVAMEGIFPSRP